MDDDFTLVYEFLKTVAGAGKTVTYSEVASMIGLTMQHPPDRRRLANSLLAICAEEQRQGHPLLCAVVVRADTGRPGKGFFAYARDLGLYDGLDDEAFFERELDRLHRHWRQAPPRST